MTTAKPDTVIQSDKSWDQFFLEAAALQSTKSKDPSSKLGCVIVRPDMTQATQGFNGIPQALSDRAEWLMNRDIKLDVIKHAEENALLFSREPLEGYTVYVWPIPPCSGCASSLIQKKVKRIVAPINPDSDRYKRWKADFDLAVEMYEEAKGKIDITFDPIMHDDPVIQAVIENIKGIDLP